MTAVNFPAATRVHAITVPHGGAVVEPTAVCGQNERVEVKNTGIISVEFPVYLMIPPSLSPPLYPLAGHRLPDM